MYMIGNSGMQAGVFKAARLGMLLLTLGEGYSTWSVCLLLRVNISLFT